jgi:hypothetical protein
MDVNPYQAPTEDENLQLAKPKKPSNIRMFLAAAFIGCLIGRSVLGPYIKVPRGPADPFGRRAYSHGAAYGGFIGLAIAVSYSVVREHRRRG